MNNPSMQAEANICSFQVILEEYKRLQNLSPISLFPLIESETFKFQDYSKNFSPHSNTTQLISIAEKWGNDYNIWLPNAKQYISCCMYLFPDSPLERMIPIVQNCGVDFYLNDVMGREVFPHLSISEQSAAESIIKRMEIYDPRKDMPAFEPVEKANQEMLGMLCQLSPASWFDDFLALYNKHISMAHRDPIPDGDIQSLEEYFEARLHISGMPHTISLIEFSTNNFLNWAMLTKLGLNKKVVRLNRVVGLIGCLLNDLFSFEKEVIDNRSKSNLVIILMSNNKSDLKEAILSTAGIVQDLYSEFAITSQILLNDIKEIGDPTFKTAVINFITGLSKVVVASWYWQCYTNRYKRINSIFSETTIN